MQARFENNEKCDGSKILASVHTIRAQFENDRNFDTTNSLQSAQESNAKEISMHIKDRSISILKVAKDGQKIFRFHHFRVFTRCRFQIVPVGVLFQNLPFSRSAGKVCSLRVNGRPIRHIFHRFQNVPEFCECSLTNSVQFDSYDKNNHGWLDTAVVFHCHCFFVLLQRENFLLLQRS